MAFIGPGTPEQLIERIRGSVIGDDGVMDGPFGPLPGEGPAGVRTASG